MFPSLLTTKTVVIYGGVTRFRLPRRAQSDLQHPLWLKPAVSNFQAVDALLLQYGRIDLIQMTLSADHPVDVPGVLDCLGSLQNSGIAVGDRELFYTWICPTATIAKSNVNYTQIFLDGCASDGVHLREVADSAATKCQDRYRWLQQLKTAGLPMNKQIAAFRPCLCKVWL